MPFKIATWNVNSLRVRLPKLLDWLAIHQPTIMAIQETKVEDKDFPIEALQLAGYHAIFSGQKTYNGVAILVKMPNTITEIVMDIPELADPQRRILATTIQGIRFLNLYVPNGQSVGSEKYVYKLNWLDRVTDYLKSQLSIYQNVVVLGDFNVAPTNDDVHDPSVWEGQVLVSDAERKALQKMMALGLHDAFRLFEQPLNSYSWWDYRAGAFHRNNGLRIDLILLSTALAKKTTNCTIDRASRKGERPSDHVPVMATLLLDPTP